jgi:hypothetical protein
VAVKPEKVHHPDTGRVIGEITPVGVWFVARDTRGRIVPASPRMDAHDDRRAAIDALCRRG